MVADSKPNKAHSVKVAAAVTPLIDSGMPTAAVTSLERTNMRPNAATATNGSTLSSVVML
jgi:hypothetical protein